MIEVLLLQKFLTNNRKLSYATKKHVTYTYLKKNVKNSGTFSGYASVFNVVDKQNHIILPGAFNSAVKKFIQSKITMAAQFNRTYRKYYKYD
ncbi:MAG: hypothetical protein ACTJLM_02785 [Ehrlichia sp.]